jgi:hypothetical protein
MIYAAQPEAHKAKSTCSCAKTHDRDPVVR